MLFVEAVRALLSAGSTSDREVIPKLAPQKGDNSGRQVLDALLAAHPALRAEVWEALLQGLVNATATAKLARKAAAELTYSLRLLAGLLAQEPAVLAKLPALVAHACQLLWTLATILTKVHGPLDAAGYPASANSAEEGGPLPAILAGLLEAAAEDEEGGPTAAAADMVDSDEEEQGSSVDGGASVLSSAGRTGVAARMLSRLEDVVALAAACLRAYAAVPAATAAALADASGGQACPLLALATSALTILREVAAGSYAGNKKLLPLLLAPGGAVGSAAVKTKAAGHGMHPAAAAAAPVLVQSLSSSLFELLLLARDKAVAGSGHVPGALPSSQAARLAALVDDCLGGLLFSPAAAPHYAAAMARSLVYAQQAVAAPPPSASGAAPSDLDAALGSPAAPAAKKSRGAPAPEPAAGVLYVPSILATERKLFDALAAAGTDGNAAVQAAVLRGLPALLGQFISGWRRAEALAAGLATETAATAPVPGGEAEAGAQAGSQRAAKAASSSAPALPPGVSEAAMAAAQAMVKAPEYGFFTELLATATGVVLPAASAEDESSSSSSGKEGAAALVASGASGSGEPVAVVTTRLRATGALVALLLEADLYSIHNDPAPHPRTRVLERAAHWALQAGLGALEAGAAAGPAALNDLLWAWTGALAAFQEAHHATVHAQLPRLLQALLTAAGACDDAATRPALLGAVSRTLLQSISVCTRLRQLDVFLAAVFEVGQRLSASDAAAASLYRRALASPPLLRALGGALRGLPPGQVEAVNALLTGNLAAAVGKLGKAAAATPADKPGKAAGSKRPRSDSGAGAAPAGAAAADVAFVAALLVAEALRQFRATAFTAAGGVKTAAAAVTAGAVALIGAGLAAPATAAGALLLAAGAEVATAAADAVVSCATYDAVRSKTPTLLVTLTAPDVAAIALDWPVVQYAAPLGAAAAADKPKATLPALIACLPALAAAANDAAAAASAADEVPVHRLALSSVCGLLEARLRLLNTCLCAPPVLRAAVAQQLRNDKADAFSLMAAAASQAAAALLACAPSPALSGCIDVVAAHAPAAAVAAWTEGLLRTPAAPSTRALLGSLRLYELAPVTAAFGGAASKLVAEAVAAAGAPAAPASSSKKTPKAAATAAKTAPEAVLVAIAGLAALPTHALLASCKQSASSVTPLVAAVLTTLAPASGLPTAARSAAMAWLASVAEAAPAAAAAALPAGVAPAAAALAALLAADGATLAAAEGAAKALLRAALLGSATAPDAVALAVGKAPHAALKAIGVSALAEALAAAALPCPPHLTAAAAAVLEAAPAAAASEVLPRLRLALEVAAVSAAGGAGALKPKAVAKHLEAAAVAAASMLQAAAATSAAEGCALLAQLAAAVQACRAGRLAACEALEGASAAPEAAAGAAAAAAASAARTVCGKLFPAEAGAPWVACVLSSSGSSLSSAVAALLPLSALVRGLLPALGGGASVEVTAQLTRTVIAAAAEAFYARATHEVAPASTAAASGAAAAAGAAMMSAEALDAVLSAAPKAGGVAEAGDVAPGATLVCEGVAAVRPVLALLADALLPALCAAAACPGGSPSARSDAALALHALRELVSHPRVLGVGFDRANAVVTALAPLAAAVSALPQRPAAVLTSAAATAAAAAPKVAAAAAGGALPFASVDVDVGSTPGCASRIVVSAAAAAADAAAAHAPAAAAAAPLSTAAASATTDTALVTAAAWVLHALVKYHPESSLACMPAVVAHAQTLLALAMTPLPATPANGREADGFLPTTTNSILVRLCEQLARHVKTARHYAVHVLATFLGAAGRRDLAGRPLFAGRGEEELLPAAFALFSVCKSDEMQQLYILLAKRPSIQALLKAYHRQYSEGRYTGKA